MTLFAKPEVTAERGEFYKRASTKGLAPLWEVLAELVPAEPHPKCVPVVWHYDEIRPFIMESGKLITAEEAERRVMVLENPGLPESRQVTNSLYAGLQLLLPGEVAPTHRHAPSALRFVVESDGAYTAVDGERTTMHPGDFIITPSRTFHDHGNTTNTPTIWMDGLDLPIVNYFDAGFAERYPGSREQPVTRNEGDAYSRYGANLMPLNYSPERATSPIFNYPYSRSREVLDDLFRRGPLDPCHGIKMQFVNPATGGYPIPSISTFIQFLPKGFKTAPYRSTDSTVFIAIEGRGKSGVGQTPLAWNTRDIFVVPSWNQVVHEATEDTVLFSFSDRAAQKALGFWREQSLG
jgi:gentisate 1,2-dioxygenase